MPIRAINPRRSSLLRGTVLVLCGLSLAFLIAFPNDRQSLLLLIPVSLASFGTFETIRCLQLRWSFYHAAVFLLLCMDVVALAMTLFLLLFPYFHLLLL